MDVPSRTRIAQGDVDGSHWLLASRTADPRLRPYVLRIDGYEERAASPQQMRHFAQPHVVLIIELGPPLRVTMGSDPARSSRSPGGFVAGLEGAFSLTEHEGVQRGVQVDLTPAGARRLFGLPLCELTPGVVALCDMWPGAGPRLALRLGEAPNWAARLDLVESMLLERILSASVQSAPVEWAVGRIEAAGGTLDVADLARELGCSHKHMIALFRDQVGTTPKVLARIVRFHRFLDCAREGAAKGADLALACGYYDESHLARDVRQFTGLSPREARLQIGSLAELLG